MKLILIDGGPASGKNTLGDLLVEKFQQYGNKAILLDLDNYVETLNATWIWNNKQKEKNDQEKARVSFSKDITNYLQSDYVVIVIGERFLTKKDITKFTDRVNTTAPTYLYHLSVPFAMRKQRLEDRGPHPLIDLAKDQRDRDLNTKWYGYIYNNINSIEVDVNNLFELIENNQGCLELSLP